MPTKKCSGCGVVKGLDMFGKHRGNPDGLTYICKKCCSKRFKTYHRSKAGLINNIYKTQVVASRKRGHTPPPYSCAELLCYALSLPEYHALHKLWVESGYDKWHTPSFDRLDDYKPYSFDNIQMVTWRYNNRKYFKDVKNGINNKRSRAVNRTDLDGANKKMFHSMAAAARSVDTSVGNIWDACKRSHKPRCGYLWEYADVG